MRHFTCKTSSSTRLLVNTIALLGLASVACGQDGVRNEPSKVILCNKRSTIVLDKETHGAIVSLVDNSKRQELVAQESTAPLFRLAFSHPGDTSGELSWLTGRDAEAVTYAVEERGSRGMVRLTFEKLGGRQLQAECTASISPDDGCILWQFALEGSEPLVLEKVGVPVGGPPYSCERGQRQRRFRRGNRQRRHLSPSQPVACRQERRFSQSAGPAGRPVRVLLRRELRLLFRHPGQPRLSEATLFSTNRVGSGVCLGAMLLPRSNQAFRAGLRCGPSNVSLPRSHLAHRLARRCRYLQVLGSQSTLVRSHAGSARRCARLVERGIGHGAGSGAGIPITNRMCDWSIIAIGIQSWITWRTG